MNGGGLPKMSERRKNERQASDEPAQIIFDEPDSTMDCTINDLSGEGACVEVSNTRLVPSEFKLVRSSGAIQLCRVAWRTRNKLGVTFS